MKKQIQDFAEKGYVTLDGVLPKNLPNRMSASLMSQLEGDKPSLGKAYSVGNKRKMIPFCLEAPFDHPHFFANPAITSLVEGILGKDYIINSIGAVVAYTGAQAQHTHRDHPHLFGTGVENTDVPCYAITVLIPLVDLNSVNGSLDVWEESHLPNYKTEKFEPKALTMSAGDCVMFDYRLYHRGTATYSKEPRPVLYMVYSRPWFRDSKNFFNHAPLTIARSVYRSLHEDHKLLFRFADKKRDTAISEDELSKQELVKWIERVFPDEGVVKIIKRTPLYSFHHKVELLKIRFKSENNLCIKAYFGQLCWWVFEEPNIAKREQLAWKIANKAGVPLAQEYGWLTNENGTFSLSKEVKGVDLGSSFSSESVIDTAKVIANLHAYDLQNEDTSFLADARIPVLIARLRDWAKEVADFDLDKAISIVEKQISGIKERPASILHGDFNPRNLLVNNNKVVAVIDWETCAIGDPRFDLAIMESCIRRRGSKELGKLFISEYENLSGFKVGDLSVWTDLLNIRDSAFAMLLNKRLASGIEIPRTQVNGWIKYGRNSLARMKKLLLSTSL